MQVKAVVLQEMIKEGCCTFWKTGQSRGTFHCCT